MGSIIVNVWDGHRNVLTASFGRADHPLLTWLEEEVPKKFPGLRVEVKRDGCGPEHK